MTRPRFTIRDLIWLTLVAALAIGWWVDRRALLSQWEASDLDSVRQPLSGIRLEQWQPSVAEN